MHRWLNPRKGGHVSLGKRLLSEDPRSRGQVIGIHGRLATRSVCNMVIRVQQPVIPDESGEEQRDSLSLMVPL